MKTISIIKHLSPPVLQLQVAAYCRVSTTQDAQSGSLRAQFDFYTQFINSRSDWMFFGIFADKASGRCNQKMHGFQDMMTACREHKIDLILVKTVSRFGRNTVEMLQTFQELRALGIDVYFEIERLHLKDPNSILMLTVFASLAQNESESKSYSICWGIRHKFAEGTSKFLSRVCYGYRSSGNALVINPDDANIVKQIFTWRAEGDSLRTISFKLEQHGVKAPRGGATWSPETLRKLLANEKYAGNVILQKTYVADYFTGRQVQNQGQMPRYLVHDNNPAIVRDANVFTL